MAESMIPKGNWFLRLLIVLFTLCLLASILYPKKLWNFQAQLIEDSRERMENLNYIVQEYAIKKKHFTDNQDSLFAFIGRDSTLVDRALFEFEKLSLYDVENDCVLVGFVDTFHFDSIAVERARNDSLLLTLLPKSLFSEVITPVQTGLSSKRQIVYFFRGKGEKDTYYIFYSQSGIRRYDLPYQVKLVPTIKYKLYRELDDLKTDPISNKPYMMNLNARITIEGKILCTMVKKGVPEHPILESELLTNLLINKMARKARAQVDADLKKDTTLYKEQLSLQSDYFEVQLEMMKPGSPVEIDENKDIMVAVDSIEVYRNPVRIKNELFHATYDSLIRVWTKAEMTQQVLALMNVTEDYRLAKIDTIGVTIRPPFTEKYHLAATSFFDRFFSVGPIDHPGFIENNDLSWSEKK